MFYSRSVIYLDIKIHVYSVYNVCKNVVYLFLNVMIKCEQYTDATYSICAILTRCDLKNTKTRFF